jgi:hypothetical protein
MGRIWKTIFGLGLTLVAVPTVWGSGWATRCHGDGCLGIILLWALGFFVALLLVMALIIRALVLRRRTGEFPRETWRWCGIAMATWGGMVAMGYVLAAMSAD